MLLHVIGKFPEAVAQICSVKKVFLQIHKKVRILACNFIKKETLAQIFSCEFCEISKNTFFTEHLWTIASHIFKFYKYSFRVAVKINILKRFI